MVSGVRRMNEVNLRRAPLLREWAGIPSRYVTCQLRQLSPASLRGRSIEYKLCWGKGGNVTSAGWQATLCDPMARELANCYIRVTSLLGPDQFVKVKSL